MLQGLQKIILNLVLSYLAHVISAAEGKIEWEKIEAELDSKLKSLLPGWIEGEAEVILHNAIYLVKAVADTEGIVEKLIQLIAAKDFAGILSYLEQLIMGHLQQTSVSVAPVEKMVAQFKQA